MSKKSLCLLLSTVTLRLLMAADIVNSWVAPGPSGGNWTDSADWSLGFSPGFLLPDEIATFGQAGSTSITIVQDELLSILSPLGGLAFSGGNSYTITPLASSSPPYEIGYILPILPGQNTYQITSDGVSNHTIEAPIALLSSISIQALSGSGYITSTGGIVAVDGDSLGITMDGGTGTFGIGGSNNTYSGNTTINQGTLLAKSANAYSFRSAVVLGDDGILNLGTFPNSISRLAGTGLITASSSAGVLTILNGCTFNGALQGDLGISLVNGIVNITPSMAGNTYTGQTSISDSATWQAGSAGAFSSSSAVVMTSPATLDLNGFANSIASLSGTGTVTLGGGALSIGAGGSFAGTISSPGTVALTGTLTVPANSTFAAGISGSGNISVTGGTLIVSGPNSYSGTTTIGTGATLQAGASDSFSSASAVTMTSATLALNGFNGDIHSLNGTGTITLGNGNLSIGAGGSFAGTIASPGIVALTGTLTVPATSSFAAEISGTGNIALTGGTLTVSGSNSYFGTTTIDTGATLSAGALNTLSSDSSVILNGTGILNLNSFNNTIKSLSSDMMGTATVILGSGILTINGGTSTIYYGSLTNTPCGGLTIDNGTSLTLMGTSNNYCGPTTIINGTLIAGNADALSPNSDMTVEANGTLNLGAFSNAVNSYTQQSGANLDLTIDLSTFGQIISAGAANLNGHLTVSNGLGMTSPTNYYLLVQSTGIMGAFATTSFSSFTDGLPNLLYTNNDAYLFFPDVAATWLHSSSGNWYVASNWTPTGVPGVVSGSSTTVTFDDTPAVMSPITVTLEDMAGSGPGQFTVNTMIFNSSNISYTIEQFNSSSSLTFDAIMGAPGAFITAELGTHTIDVPMILNVDTFLQVYPSAGLTFGSNATMVSNMDQEFSIFQNSPGVGGLTNNGNLTPSIFTALSGNVSNSATINPGNLLISGQSGHEIQFNNVGTGAVVTSSGVGLLMVIGGEGTTGVQNSGTNGQFGPMATDASLSIGGFGGITTVLNNGTNAKFGAFGSDGNFEVISPGTTTITNTGTGTLMGAFGLGGSVIVSGGTVNNTLGALFQAGSGGSFTISGGTVVNDLTSTVGTQAQDMTVSSGTLSTSGSVLANNYTQNGGTLQINLTSMPYLIGTVSAAGTAQVGGNLLVNALPNSNVAVGQMVDLLIARGGVTGTFTPSFENFPNTIIPTITYLQQAVVLDLTASTVSPSTSVSSIPELSFIWANQNNFELQRHVFQLHNRVIEREVPGLEIAQLFAENEEFLLLDEIEEPLPAKTEVKKVRPWNFYVGPIDSLGTIHRQSSTQAGINYNSIGVLSGFDYAFSSYGLGFSAAYNYNAGHASYGGRLWTNELHVSGYGIWAPKSIPELGLSAIVGWGYEWARTKRIAGTNSAPAGAYGSPDGLEVDALICAEYIFENRKFSAIPKNMQFTPLVNLQYIYTQLDAYNEHGAGMYSLHVNKQTPSSLRSLIGARLDHLFVGDGVKFKPEFDIGWQYEYLNQSRGLGFATVNLASPQLVSTQVVGAARNTLWIGLDFLVTVKEVFEIEASYDLQWNSVYYNNGFYLGIGGNY